jgi:hypothetical protein
MRDARIATTGRAALAAIALLLSASAWSADPPSATSATQAVPSKDVREKMAALHEQMAACLRSDKSFVECRTEMKTSCLQTVGAQGCPMMGMGRGMGRGRMMQAPPASAPK